MFPVAMYEYAKLEEARYFLDKIQHAETEQDFVFNFSALLNAARSVVQYALEEHNTTPGGRLALDATFNTWYQAHLNEELRLLKAIRDENIHVRPTSPTTITAHVDMVMMVTFTRPGGSATAPAHTPTLPSMTKVTGATVDVVRHVPSWQHSDDIVDVAQRIVAAVDTFVLEGVRDGQLKDADA